MQTDRFQRPTSLARLTGGTISLCVLIAMVPAGSATANPAALCEQAAMHAVRQTGVPLNVLRAIALTESGRRRDGRMQPWPWTLNADGQGLWLHDRAEAEARFHALRASGARSIDVGCFQINHRWHGARFASLDAMLDPQQNADYAARLLVRLRARHGTWRAAVGAYHSATPALAARYLERFDRALAAQGAVKAETSPAPRAAAMRRPRGPDGVRALIALHGAAAGPGSVFAPVRSEAPAAPIPAPVAAGGLALGMLR